MADDADMRNELSDMQQRADQLADEVRTPDLLHRRRLPRDGRCTLTDSLRSRVVVGDAEHLCFITTSNILKLYSTVRGCTNEHIIECV